MPNSDLELKNLLSGSNASSLDPKTKTCVCCCFVRIEQFWARLVFEETEQKTILRQSIRSFLSGATGANIDREITSLLLRAVDLSYGRVPKRYKKWIQPIKNRSRFRIGRPLFINSEGGMRNCIYRNNVECYFRVFSCSKHD